MVLLLRMLLDSGGRQAQRRRLRCCRRRCGRCFSLPSHRRRRDQCCRHRPLARGGPDGFRLRGLLQRELVLRIGQLLDKSLSYAARRLLRVLLLLLLNT